MKAAERIARRHIARGISDPRLRRAVPCRDVRPDYTMGCKRILNSNDYYPALARENVEVVTGGVAEVREHSVVGEDGVERPADALILATGFHVTDAFDHLTLKGRGGLRIQDAWRGRKASYLDVRAAVQERFVRDVDDRMSKTVWLTGGCDSWYLAPDGKNHTLWPGSTWSYWLRTRRLEPADYELIQTLPAEAGQATSAAEPTEAGSSPNQTVNATVSAG